MGARTQLHKVDHHVLCSQAHWQRFGPEGEQQDSDWYLWKLESIWDTGTLSGGFMCYATALTPFTLFSSKVEGQVDRQASPGDF